MKDNEFVCVCGTVLTNDEGYTDNRTDELFCSKDCFEEHLADITP